MITAWKTTAQDSPSGAIDYVLAPHVSLALAGDGTARLLDMGGGFYALAPVGAEMLQAVLERGSAAAVQELAQRYEVGTDRVRADLDSLLGQLQQQGVLQPSGRHRRDASLWVAAVLAPCLYGIRVMSSGWVRALLVLTLVKLSLLCFGWGQTVTAWQRRLRRFAPGGVPMDEQAVRSLDQTVRRIAAGHPLPMACKERALACWALLHWGGVSSALVVGLDFFPLMGHCWCEAGGRVVSDYDDNCELYMPVARYELLPEVAGGKAL